MEVMRAIRLKSAVENAIKDLTSFLFYIPKAVFKTWLEIQLKVVCFPFRLVPAVMRLASRRSASEQVNPAEESATDLGSPSNLSSTEPTEPSCEDVVRQTKKLRNCVAMSIDQFTGNDLFWDMPILKQKVERFSEICFEGDPVKIAEARKAIKKHPVYYPKPKSREEYDRLMEEARNIGDTVPKSRRKSLGQEDVTSLHHDVTSKCIGNCVKETKAVSNVLNSKKKVEFRLDNYETLNTNKENRHKRLSQQNKRLRKQLISTNNKLEEVLKSSASLIKEVSRLSGQFTKLANVNAKMSNMEGEINEGKKLMREIEEDRNTMRIKLLALEQMIKEEENYLDELSCESGYDDFENVCDSHEEL